MNKDKIKNVVIDNTHREYSYAGLTREDVEGLFNSRVTEEDLTPRVVYKTKYLNEDKLFGQTPEAVSEYLSEISKKLGNGTVEQCWEYSEEHYIYRYKGVEDSDEVRKRISAMVCEAANEYRRKKEKILEKEKKIKELEKALGKEIADLKELLEEEKRMKYGKRYSY